MDLQSKRGTLAQIRQYTGREGEVVFATDIKKLFVMDGVNPGGSFLGTDYAPRRFMIDAGTSGHRSLTIKAGTTVFINGATPYVFTNDYTFSAQSALDTGSSLTNGKDYFVYLVLTNNDVQVKVSLNGIAPAGYDVYRLIGGFHTECVNIGTISEHLLSGYAAGDILPSSVWCINHFGYSFLVENHMNGTGYCDLTDSWGDIYNMDENGNSVYGGNRAKNLQHYQFSELLRAHGKTLLGDEEFFIMSQGSNQQTNVAGSAQPNPDTTGGRSDTAGRRMVSHYGYEEMCGLQWQHLRNACAAGGSGWNAQAGGQGQFYGSNMVRLAGGAWVDGAGCGSRSRSAGGSLSGAVAVGGARGRSPAIHEFA